MLEVCTSGGPCRMAPCLSTGTLLTSSRRSSNSLPQCRELLGYCNSPSPLWKEPLEEPIIAPIDHLTGPTHRLHSSSFLGLPYRILNMNRKKELLWSLWVTVRVWSLESLCGPLTVTIRGNLLTFHEIQRGQGFYKFRRPRVRTSGIRTLA